MICNQFFTIWTPMKLLPGLTQQVQSKTYFTDCVMGSDPKKLPLSILNPKGRQSPRGLKIENAKKEITFLHLK